jgi:hypothetical protein
MTVQQYDRRAGTAVPEPQSHLAYVHVVQMETVEHQRDGTRRTTGSRSCRLIAAMLPGLGRGSLDRVGTAAVVGVDAKGAAAGSTSIVRDSMFLEGRIMTGWLGRAGARTLARFLPTVTASAQPCVRRCWYETRCAGRTKQQRRICQFYTCELTYGPWQSIGQCPQ